MPDHNQSPDFSGFNAFASDPMLDTLTLALPQQTRGALHKVGQWAGNADTLKLGRLANQNPPVLHTHNAKGDRVDEVEFHPAWHALMRRGVEHGLHNSLWGDSVAERGARNLTRAAKFYLTTGVESGHTCPLTMTSASVAAMSANESLLNEWLPKIMSGKYDSTNRPMDQKQGVLVGMGMTERQGGSDVRTNTTSAEAQGNGIWEVNGAKWFFSAPMCDAFLVLAQMPEGPGCFLIPRLLEHGRSNGIQLLRLKDKLGNRSNASSEVEFHSSLGILVGDPGRGISAIMEMVNFTRLDCAVGSAGLMRASLSEAVHHCRHRSAFGKKLVEQPIMERVLADLALDSAAATALVFRLASAYDRASANPAEAAYARFMTPVIKYWVCKLAPALTYEAMECLGGNGYVETGNMARRYREAPLNAIWEGAGNVMCLDVLRVVNKSPEIVETVLSGLQSDMGQENSAAFVDVIRSATEMSGADPGGARILVEQLALTAAAAELNRLGAGVTAKAFTDTRLGGLWRSSYGMLDNRYNAKAILEKEHPPLS